MDKLGFTKISTCCKYEHLITLDRGKIGILYNIQNKNNHHIANILNCSPKTISNELRRGILNKTFNQGQMFIYIYQTSIKGSRKKISKT